MRARPIRNKGDNLDRDESRDGDKHAIAIPIATDTDQNTDNKNTRPVVANFSGRMTTGRDIHDQEPQMTGAAYVLDLDTETADLIDLAGARELFAKWRAGKAPHVNRVRSWCTTGGAGGIVLPSALVGGRRITSVGACRWWVAATTAASMPSGRPAAVAGSGPSPADRAVLERAGIVDAPAGEPAKRRPGRPRKAVPVAAGEGHA